MTSKAGSGEQARHSAVRYVLFDAVGTLIYPDPPAAEVYRAAGQRFGSRLSADVIEDRFRQAIAAWNEPAADGLGSVFARPPTDEATERRRWQSLVEAVFTDVADAGGALFESLWRHFAQPEHWRLFDDVALVLAELGRRGYRLGIASNFDARLHAVAAGHPPIDMPTTTFVSSDVGYSKPDLRFFRAVESRLTAAPHEIVLVGDDPVSDTLGARNAGWHAIQLDRTLSRPTSGCIASLVELLGWFFADAGESGGCQSTCGEVPRG